MSEQYPDLFEELEHLALGSRLKRLSERMMSDVARIYKHYGHDLEPGMFPVLACLDRFSSLGIVEMAQCIGVSQPSISRAVKDLKKRKLVKFSYDRQDLRKKNVELSTEGLRTVQRLKEGLWPAVRQAATELCRSNGTDFLDQIRDIERRLAARPLSERTKYLDTPQDAVEILPFNEDLAGYFDSINREWIQAMFKVEATDDRILRYPQEDIIAKGGAILFARTSDGIMGTGALLKTGEGKFELTKMGVLQKSRGMKVGEKLLRALIAEAHDRDAKLLYLLTNTDCAAAIHLYEKNGFAHDEGIMEQYGRKYQRCNVAMKYIG